MHNRALKGPLKTGFIIQGKMTYEYRYRPEYSMQRPLWLNGHLHGNGLIEPVYTGVFGSTKSMDHGLYISPQKSTAIFG